jgi:multiple sugar transport system permease protein
MSKSKRTWRNENLAGYLFVLPSFAGFVVFVLFPMLFSLFLSFCDWSFIAGLDQIKLVGLKNFALIAQDYQSIAAVQNTLFYTATTVPATVILGFLLAVLLNKYVYGKDILKIAVFMPYISSIVAVSVVWRVLLYPSFGPVNEFLRSIGISNPPKWFGDPKWALPAIVIESVWIQLGYNVVVFLAGLTAINQDLYDAASIDGAGAVRRLVHVTIPGVEATTFFLFIMGVIGSFKVFDQISVITQGGPGSSTLVLAYYIYQNAFQFYNMGYASAIAWMLFVVIFVITAVQWRFGNREAV